MKNESATACVKCNGDPMQPGRRGIVLLATTLFLITMALGACTEDRSSPNTNFAVDPTTSVPGQPHIRTPPLTEQHTPDSDNLLEPDPEPMVSEQAIAGGELRRAEPQLPDRYTWMTEVVVPVTRINAYVTEPLARRHQRNPMKWSGVVARRITRSDDGRVYTVELKPGVFWARPFAHTDVPAWLLSQDRQELTSEDFKFAFDMVQDERLIEAAPARSWYSECKKLTIVDRYTFKMEWNEAGLAAEVWTMMFTPLPEHILAYRHEGGRIAEPALSLDDHYYRWPIGTGPYRLVAEDAMSATGGSLVQSMVLEQNPDYHGVLPPISRVRFANMEGREALTALLNGDLDVTELTPSLYGELVRDARANSPLRKGYLKLHEFDEYSYFYIGWNMRPGFPTEDVRVRRALTMALNREWMVEGPLRGLALLADGPYASSSPFDDPDVEPWPFDLRRAGDLLDEAGWLDVNGDGVREKMDAFGSRRLSLQVAILGPPEIVPALGRFERDAASVGIELRFVPWSPDIPQTEYDGWYSGWGHDWEDDPYQVFHSSQIAPADGSNKVAYRSDEADELIERIRTETDMEKRVELHRQLHRMLHEDQPYTFLFEEVTAWVTSPRVRGVRFQVNQPHDLSFGWWLSAN